MRQGLENTDLIKLKRVANHKKTSNKSEVSEGSNDCDDDDGDDVGDYDDDDDDDDDMIETMMIVEIKVMNEMMMC